MKNISRFILLFRPVYHTMLFFGLFLWAFPAPAQESHVYHHMWPSLSQPWYFSYPSDVAVDGKGYVYVVDTDNAAVQKFTRDGRFVTRWGKPGGVDGRFLYPTAISVDSNGYVYVADSIGIQKFTSNGGFVKSFKGLGIDAASFRPSCLHVDGRGYLFTVNLDGDRILKLTTDLEFVLDWGGSGTGEGEFNAPYGIVSDGGGFVYVSDTNNHRIQKFDSQGNYIARWGSSGQADGLFNYPTGITITADGYVVVSDFNNRIQIFNSNGDFLSKLKIWELTPMGLASNDGGDIYIADPGNQLVLRTPASGPVMSVWDSRGDRPGEFQSPEGIALNSDGDVFVVDKVNYRIQKFTPAGEFLLEWGEAGSGDGQFNEPHGIAADESGFVYVADMWNHRIQKFDSTGEFVDQWGTAGDGDGQFNSPQGVAVGDDGYVYVADTDNHRIQKFDRSGTFVLKWGVLDDSSGDGLYKPRGVAVGNGFVYVTDQLDRVKKFDASGVFIDAWGSTGLANGRFNYPCGIAVDSENRVYVVDEENNRIQKFSDQGDFIANIGSAGTGPGLLNSPKYLCIGSDGAIYVTDKDNNRVQVFKKKSLATGVSKAVVIAGGGPYPGNNLWDATRMCAAFAYRTLTNQGYAEENIRYMTFDTDLDPDGDGESDDVFSAPSNSLLESSATSWASDADRLLIYMAGHGGDGTFRINETELLSASDLDAWLDALQRQKPCEIIVIYDACRSGGFLQAMAPPVGSKRILITGTAGNEEAYFINQGATSFSYHFWSAVFTGRSVLDSFEYADNTLNKDNRLQTPLADADGDGVPNEPTGDFSELELLYIGNGTGARSAGPLIQGVSVTKSGDDAIIIADSITDADGVDSVWAVITPPGFTTESSTDTVTEFPRINLLPNIDDTYGARYTNIYRSGEYQFAIYAVDGRGNTSGPVTVSVSFDNPLTRKAIIVAGAGLSGDSDPVHRTGAQAAYRALTRQGYKPFGAGDTLYYLSPASDPGVAAAPSYNSLNYAVTDWASENTLDVIIYLIGENDNGRFRINADETLDPATLGDWLDTLQSAVSGTISVIMDMDSAGGFFPDSAPSSGQERILAAGAAAGFQAPFYSDGLVSFSTLFWAGAGAGESVGRSFLNALEGLKFFSGASSDQLPQLDDSGNGIGNEREDGALAMDFFIGDGVRFASGFPIIGNSPPEIVLSGSETTLWVDHVTTIGEFSHVTGVVVPPDYGIDPISGDSLDYPSFRFHDAGSGRFEAVYDDFPYYGTYRAVIYAVDTNGDMSPAKTLSIFKPDGPDIYEEDDGADRSSWIDINDETPQRHNFHDAGDTDWIRFLGVSEKVYTIRADNLESDCNPVLELYDETGAFIDSWDSPLDPTADEIWDWRCDADGIYYVAVRHADPSVFGAGTGYDFQIFPPISPFVGYIKGTITDASTGQPIQTARVSTDKNASALSRPGGAFRIIQEPGSGDITIRMDGYQPLTLTGVEVSEGGTTIRDIALTPLIQDADGDGIADRLDNCVNTSNPDQSDQDGDGVGDACDGCPADPLKITPGVCGCGAPDTDADGDGVPDCNDVADRDGDGVEDSEDGCPDDPQKTEPGVCGCGVSDTDRNGDGVPDCLDNCPNDPNKSEPGVCGCGIPDTDTDMDGVADCKDGCPNDSQKIEPLQCGCGEPETDADNDGIPDCLDQCPEDPEKTEPGICGCGIADTDLDGDGVYDCTATLPGRPVPVFPLNGETGMILTPLLQLLPFSIPGDERRHAETRWAISLDPEFNDMVFDLTTNLYLTSLPIPHLILREGEIYYWRAMFIDDEGSQSIWSESNSFSTAYFSGEDADSDGVPDDQTTSADTDFDGDGEPDRYQTDMLCVQTVAGNSTVCVKGGEGVATIAGLRSDDAGAAGVIGGMPEPAPLGLISVRAVLSPNNDMANLIVYFSKSAPENTKIYTFHPSSGRLMDSGNALFGEDRTNAAISVEDGGESDADGVRNGVVVVYTATGPPFKTSSFSFAPPSDDVEGIGCFIGGLSD